MSFFPGRKTSQLSIYDATNELVIIDNASYYRLIQMFIVVVAPLSSVLLLQTSFETQGWISILKGFLIGSFSVAVPFLLFCYFFKSSAAYRIRLNSIEELLVFKTLVTKEDRLSVKLKNGKYRNLILNPYETSDSMIAYFEGLNVPVNRRENYSFLPLNY